MIARDNSDKLTKVAEKLDAFRKNHSDMENELKRRLLALKKKNIRMFLKQIDAI